MENWKEYFDEYVRVYQLEQFIMGGKDDYKIWFSNIPIKNKYLFFLSEIWNLKKTSINLNGSKFYIIHRDDDELFVFCLSEEKCLTISFSNVCFFISIKNIQKKEFFYKP